MTNQNHAFALLSIIYRIDDNGVEGQRFLTSDSVRERLNSVTGHLNSMSSYHILKQPNTPINSDSAYLEVIEDNDQYIFGKLCKEQDIKHFQIRDPETSKARKIDKKPYELFECYSYFMIEKENFSISYLREQSAPNINYIKYFIDNIFSDDKVWGRIVTLVDEDAIAMLSQKDIIGSISYDMTFPAGFDEAITGLTEKEYDLLRNQKATTVSINLKADKRKKSVFESIDDSKNFFKSFVGNMRKNIKVNAKNINDNYMQSYRLVENPFSKKASFKIKDKDVDFQKMIEQTLWEKYQLNRDNISTYI